MWQDRGNVRAFTLVEATVSLAIVSVLVVGMMSAIVVTSRAIPDATHPSHAFAVAQPELDRLLDDIQGATHVLQRSPWAVTFVIPDRDDDGYPEVVHYEWSGQVDAPLLRRANQGTLIPVLEQVGDFRLDFTSTQVGESWDGPWNESAETLLSYATATGGGSEIERLRDTNWVGQSISPVLPPEAVAWRVTRGLVYAARTRYPYGNFSAVIQVADDTRRPSGVIIDRADLAESVLPGSGGAWVELPVRTDVKLSPEQSVCVFFETRDTSAVGKFTIETDGTAGGGLIRTETQSPPWSRSDSDAMLHYLYGTIYTSTSSRQFTREFLTVVRAGVQTTASPESRVETSSLLLNTPEVLKMVWETDFDADPTRLDLNDDGVMDWRNSDGSPFDVNKLSDGKFWADGALDTNPGYDFDAPTTVDLRFRDVTDDEAAGGLIIRADRSGSTYAFIQAEISNVGNLQTLTITTYDDAMRLITPIVASLEEGWIDLQVVVDPEADTFRVFIDGADYGAVRYGRITATSAAVIRLYEDAEITGVQFDWIRVRVGGTTG